MIYQFIPYPRFKAFTTGGLLASGYLLWTYKAGTSTAQAVYQDPTCSTAHTNPVELDSVGEAVIYLKAATKFVLTEPGGNPASPVWSMDNVITETSTSVVYVQWYGAVGDGVTDDSVAIQAAIDSGAGAVICPLTTASSYVAGQITSGNYYLGTSQIVINRPMQFLSPVGVSFMYDGVDGPFKIDLSGDNFISGLEFKVGNIDSNGSYCILIDNDNSTGILENSVIEAGWLNGYTSYGIKIDTLGAYNKFDIRRMLAKQPVGVAELAWAFYYSLTHTGGAGFEGNIIRIGNIYNQRGIYGDVYFRSNDTLIDYDGGTQTEANKIDIAGYYNHFAVQALFGTLGVKQNSIILRSTAKGNTFSGWTYCLNGVRDEANDPTNQFPSTSGVQNLIKNPSFESWGCLDAGTYAPTDWTLNNVTAEYEATEKRHGNYSVKITSTSSVASLSQALPATVLGNSVTVSGWVMAPITNTKTANIELADSVSSTSTAAIPADGKWRFLALTYTFTGVSAGLFLFANVTADATAGEILYVDGLTLNLGENNPVFPAQINEHTLYAEGAYSGTINAGASAAVVLNCLGAAIGDVVTVTCLDVAGLVQDVFYEGHVYAADHVRVTIRNSSGSGVTINGNIRVAVKKEG